MKASTIRAKTVLVTGCSSGIGQATARHLRALGWEVFPTARKPADLETLRAEGFDPITLDLGESRSVQEAIQTCLARASGGLGAIVNNAGMAIPGAVEDLSRDTLRKQFEVNLFGLHELTRGVLPTLRAQGWGRVVNVSSIYGRVAAPFVGAYCASKFALEALSDSLRVELSGTGITVSLIEPGPIVSAFRRNAAVALEEEVIRDDARYGDDYKKQAARRKAQIKQPDFFTRPPEAVAKRMAHALESSHPRRRYVITPPAHLGVILVRVFPAAWVDWVMARQIPR